MAIVTENPPHVMTPQDCLVVLMMAVFQQSMDTARRVLNFNTHRTRKIQCSSELCYLNIFLHTNRAQSDATNNIATVDQEL